MGNFLDWLTTAGSGSMMSPLDWIIVAAYFIIILGVGLSVSRRAGKNAESFFLGGRSQPWWLLGFSMVATTFSTDTPNLVTDIVRRQGVAGNWSWWAFLLTGMLTVFIYARLWRRSGVLTDVEFYEMRYSGKWATFLRGFRAVYLGFLFNVLVMATVSLAAIKIGGILLGLTPFQTIFIASIVVLLICAISGFEGVLLTDFLLFILAMVGAIAAAVFSIGALPESVGGFSGMMETLKTDPKYENMLSIVPQGKDFFTLMLIPLAVQWWASYYPGAEPGGGGYLVQKMLAAKDEKNATGATLFFNVAHYALRPWPWIIVALASLFVFPTIPDIIAAFPHLKDTSIISHDAAYPAMLKFLPAGVLGVMMASLLAAYMSTIGTHLNWGASYMANDVYKRFIKPSASAKEVVWIGRISTLVLLVVSAFIAFRLTNAKQAFDLIVMMGAGTGLLLILRWFWWRINAICEFTAMIVSFVIAVALTFVLVRGGQTPADAVIGTEFICRVPGAPIINPMYHLPLNVAITTIAWLIVAFTTNPTDKKVLREFVAKTNPGGPGWKKVFKEAEADGQPIQTTAEATNIPKGILQMVLGCFSVYSALFATGYYLYGSWISAVILTVVFVASATTLTLTIVKKSK